MGQLGLDRASGTRISSLFQRRDLAVSIECEPADVSNEALEFLVARHEVGLGVDLDDRADEATRCNSDETFGGNPTSFAGGRCQALFPQPVDRGLDIAAG